MREGFLYLDDPANVGDDELFAHVDWTRTQAYAMGLNGLYLNRMGRENGGIVADSEVQQVKDMLTSKLLEFRDPKDGKNVVGKVYDPLTAFQGRNLKMSPDLFVGYRRGYRGSWQTALGGVPEDADRRQYGGLDRRPLHGFGRSAGGVLSNRKMKLENPQLYDVTATILHEFGVPKASGMLGESVF